ncbi:MAG: DNA replication and repair protein RecF [Patescibacteria group bacterium]
MILKKINLNQFRNATEASYDFHELLTIIIGENARGKTNLLESLFFSVNGVGFRESKEQELILWEKESAFVDAAFSDGDSTISFQIFLKLRGETVEKQFTVNKSKKTHKQYQEYQTKAVLFAPEHIDIISGSPDKRREYFNKVISLFDYEYKRKLTNYEHALRKRNKILEHHRDIQTLQEELIFWNDYLEEQATYITAKREEYINYLNQHKKIDDRQFEIFYQKNILTRALLEFGFDEERKWRKTLIGPQKDDFVVSLIENDVKENVHHYGSRSEQRLGVFWFKLNEIQFLESYFKQKPILLLDDVFSELDVKNKKLVFELVKNYQTVLTTTEDELLELPKIEHSVIRI